MENTKHGNFQRGASRAPIIEPEEAPAFLSIGATPFHLPNSLLNPDLDREYGCRTYRCGGVDDRVQFDLSLANGWIPAKSSEHPEFQNAPAMNVYGDSQDDLIRIQGQVVMYRKKEVKEYFTRKEEGIIDSQRATVGRYRKPHRDDHDGPYADRGYGCY